MRAKCIRLVNSVTGQNESRNPWLTVDKEYTVLAISVIPGREPMFRIVGDDGRTPALFEACQFVVTEPNMSPIWRVHGGDNGGLEFGPSAWLRRGFWEEYFDGSPGANTDFKVARATLIRETEQTR
jgi:hypothetical protein